MNKPTIALIYDFDKTLTFKDQQDYTFIPSLGMTSSEFWGESDRISKENNMDRILAYMYLMIKQARKKDVPITREAFNKLGADVVLLPGVKTWFKRINEFGEKHGAKIEHYIISSGLKEIMEGTPIAKYFKEIYGCEFHYNTNGNADWPTQVVNYTTKTQFLFRINKGALDVNDNTTVNTHIPHSERKVHYRNMIYIGDGLTDVPCMTLVKERGGESIALYHGQNKGRVANLLLEDRVGFICNANYTKDSELEVLIQRIISNMITKDNLIIEHEMQKESLKDK
ncbi:MAG: haloacid dehalogenase-like hydrolase [Bacilli bacterium]|nr:haloacid dehalogenase-like hydrolase [Bacilli bacterium]